MMIIVICIKRQKPPNDSEAFGGDDGNPCPII